MGTLRGDNGGDRPPNGDGLPGGDGLSGLPPEWGVVIIPNDASELDHEATKVRRELRRHARRLRWRRWLRIGPPRAHPSWAHSSWAHSSWARRGDSSALGLPMLIMTIAIIATLTSLFALAWPARSTQRDGTTGPVNTTVSAPPMPDLTLPDATGASLRLRDHLPAVLLLVDGCSCADLINATSRAVAPGVTVLAVARSAPAPHTPTIAGRTILALTDRDSALRGTYAPGSTGVVAVLVDHTGRVVQVSSNVTTIADIQPALSAVK